MSSTARSESTHKVVRFYLFKQVESGLFMALTFNPKSVMEIFRPERRQAEKRSSSKFAIARDIQRG